MHEHAEPQINKALLQIQKRPSATSRYGKSVALFRSDALIAGKHRGRRSLGGQPEEVSSCRHLLMFDSSAFFGRDPFNVRFR